MSRNKIDAQIQLLRQQLEDLKEIRRHLKKKRPTSLDDFDDEDLLPMPSTTEKVDRDIFDSFEQSSESNENYTLSYMTENPNNEGFRNKSNRRNDKRKEEAPRTAKRRNKFNNNNNDLVNMSSVIDYGLFETNTTSKPVQFTNHHRHHHRLYVTTTESDFSSSTMSSTPDYEDKNTTETVFDTPNRFMNRVSKSCVNVVLAK